MWASRRRARCHQAIDSGSAFPVGNRMYTNHRIDRDGHWQQPGTNQIRLVLPSGPTGPAVMHRRGFTGSQKKPSVKADLAIYSHVADASRQCMSISLIFGFQFL